MRGTLRSPLPDASASALRSLGTTFTGEAFSKSGPIILSMLMNTPMSLGHERLATHHRPRDTGPAVGGRGASANDAVELDLNGLMKSSWMDRALGGGRPR